ncbi:MAG: tetratricopeptide repeat protein, partial [Anaerolineae bacterium]|nr:tetratricopeptide repeat protein [Anaerolineae bacterium]
RIASNMGNAIFVAAYLIMAALPTLARVVDAFRSILTDEDTSTADVLRAAAYIFTFLVQVIAIWYTQSRGPLMGLLAGLAVWAFLGLLSLQHAARREQPFHPRDLLKDLGWGAAFGLGSLVAAGAAAAGLYFASQAILGPDSGLPQTIAIVAAVLVLLGLWLTFVVNRRGWRWLWISAMAMAVPFIAGFLVINLVEPVQEWSRQQSELRRLATVLQSESGTGMVRNLIWEGGLDMILPHDPIQFPPTTTDPNGHPDTFNSMRFLIGYGPESMYVAYNPFYPPLLGHYESRTASPDRSHNETLDSLIITGLLGFSAYLWLFGGVFYFGLRWLGVLPDDWRRTLFFALLVVGAAVAVAVVIPTVGPHFFGLAIPAGMVGGLFIYLVVYGISMYWEPEAAPKPHPRFILLTGILSAIVAHFIEINFGIGIASTRTTFWAFAGVLVVAGLNLIREREEEEAREQGSRGTKDRRRHKKRRQRTNKQTNQQTNKPTLPAWLCSTLAIALLGGFILGTLAFDFITNSERLAQPLLIIWRALTILPAQDSRTSYGALMIFAFTWLMSAVIFTSEMAKRGTFRERKGDWSLATVLYLLISLTVGLGFALVLTGRHASLLHVQAQTLEDVIGVSDRIAGVLTCYYWFIVFVLIAGGGALFLGIRRLPRQTAQSGPWSVIAPVVLTILVSAIVVTTNLKPIQADIVYKQANHYERQKQWLVAVEHYKHALELAPREDFYHLYLGRAYLEYASTLDDPAVREAVLRQTEQTLIEARETNPLNTDHSANLARMYRRWADFASDGETRQDMLQRSADNYTIATTLSPHNAILWNEWATLYLHARDFERAQETISHSLELDPDFDQTWTVQADIYVNQNVITDAVKAYEQALEINPRLTDVWLRLGDIHVNQKELEEAVEAYEQALEISPKRTQVWRVLGSIYAQLGRLDDAVAALQQALELAPEASDAWDTHRMMAIIYSQLGQGKAALSHAQTALELAPEDQQPAMQALVAQLQQ